MDIFSVNIFSLDLLAVAWFFIIGFCLLMYVLLDGFDLGVGILFPLFPQADRDIMISTILPIWDGNQTWLVLGGASLYGAFPLAFSLLLPALYLPIFIMILALLFRGITFEFRLKAKKSLWLWDSSFFLSSTLATFSQGLILGTFVKGFRFTTDTHILTYEQLFTPFNITCGISLIFGYVLLGASWMIAKTSDKLQAQFFPITKICLLIISIALVVISIWTPFIDDSILRIWFNPDYMYKLAILPFTTGCLILYFVYCLHKRYEYILFWLAIGIFFCSYAGFGISTWPYIVPHQVAFWQAAAPHSSLLFMLVGAMILLPILIAYTFYSYYIFRGKLKEALEY